MGYERLSVNSLINTEEQEAPWEENVSLQPSKDTNITPRNETLSQANKWHIQIVKKGCNTGIQHISYVVFVVVYV